jgi:ATP phosphoribosyltransferase
LIRFALPTGDLRRSTAAFLAANGLGSAEYAGGSRTFRPAADDPGLVSYRVFRERDIPIQVALGNYHAGICSSAAVDELLARYPSEGIVKLSLLGFGRSTLAVVSADGSTASDCVTIVSEYPNMAEAFLLRERVDRYRVLGVSGLAANYPPEDADLALVSIPRGSSLDGTGLRIVSDLGESSACLVANRKALASVDLSSLFEGLTVDGSEDSSADWRLNGLRTAVRARPAIRLAVPDGHQQREAPEACRKAGLKLDDYSVESTVPRPQADGEDLDVKVIRPHDMPRMVALGYFDLAITGRDCLLNHVAEFPSSPVEEVVDLGRQRYRWAAVVHRSLDASDLPGALRSWRAQGRETIRVASEYPNLADQFARERHLGRYQVIPVVGASEGFVPEDAEILIEGSETGRTWKANDLVPLEWLFESTMIVIAGKNRGQRANRGQVERLAQRFKEVAA